MINEMLREVSTLENIDAAPSEQILLWAQRVEAQRAQKEVLDNIKEARNLDSTGQIVQKGDYVNHKKQQ